MDKSLSFNMFISSTIRDTMINVAGHISQIFIWSYNLYTHQSIANKYSVGLAEAQYRGMETHTLSTHGVHGYLSRALIPPAP